MGCCNPPPKCCGYLAFLGNFTAPKMVLIKDWRLGLLLRSLQILIAFYIIFDLINKGAYLQISVPRGSITPFNDNSGIFGSEFGKEVSPDVYPYCFDESRYRFSWRGTAFEGFKCVWATPASVISRGESETFFTTYFTVEKTLYVKPLTGGGCPVPGAAPAPGVPAVVPAAAVQIDRNAQICIYHMETHNFPLGPEYSKLSFLHSYMGLDGTQQGAETHIMTPGLTNVDSKTIDGNEHIDMNLTTWLSYAGVDLDKPLDQQPVSSIDRDVKVNDYMRGMNPSPEENNTYPYARLSGVVFDVTISYFQRKLAPAPFRIAMGPNAYKVICIIDIEPHFRWSTKGTDVRYMIKDADGPVFLHANGVIPGNPGELVGNEVNFRRQGLQFRFHTGGKIGRFSFRSLVTALVTYSVMLSIAQTITTYTALYGLGISSTLYKEFILESVLWRKEYARYAAQALVAGYAFTQYDKDCSLQLSRKEIYAQLKVYFGKELQDDKVAALADFLMRQGEDDVQDADDVDDAKYSTINLFEWIDIFTEGKVCRASLRRLIDHEYKDKTEREDLMRLAMEPTKTPSAIEEALATTPLLGGESSGVEGGGGQGGPV